MMSCSTGTGMPPEQKANSVEIILSQSKRPVHVHWPCFFAKTSTVVILTVIVLAIYDMRR